MEQDMMPQGDMTQGMPPEDAGRGTDTVIAHMSLGEVVIPREFFDDPDVMQMLQALFQQNGADMAEFTVGDPANKINPETGYPEFGFFKSIGRFLRKAAPYAALALNFVPGLQGLGTALGSSILGAGATGASTLGNALIGGGLGALSGKGKGALLGAIGGGVGANIGSLAGTGGEEFGPFQNGGGPIGPAARSGSGLLGALSKATGLTSNSVPSTGGLVGGSSGGGSSFGSIGNVASAVGGLSENSSLKKQKNALLNANNKQMANLESFDPSGITSDPGYKFNLDEGQKGLDRSLSASGDVFSGKGLKAASAYNQNYASNAFKDYYNRWLTKTGAKNTLIGSGGDIRANAAGAGSQNLAQTLANIFGSRVGGYGQLDPETLRKLLGYGGVSA